MRVTPRSDEELSDTWPIGDYKFEVLDAKETTSKKGNEMIELTCKIWSRGGKEKLIKDHLLDSFPTKLKNFCKATGLLESYNAQQLNSDKCLGKDGVLTLAIETDDSGQFPPKNKITNYKKGELQASPKEPEFDDDIPF